MAYARGSGTVGTRSFIPVKYSALVLDILDKMTVGLECVSRDYEGDIKNSGDSVIIRDFNNSGIGIRDYTVDSNITYDITGENSQTMFVDQIKYTAYQRDKVDMKQTDVKSVEEELAKRAAVQFRYTIDTFVLGLFAGGAPANNTIGGTASGQVIELTPDSIYSFFVDMMTVLKDSNAHQLGEDFYAIVPPAVMGVISKSSQLTQATVAGDGVIRKGYKGQFAGFTLKESTNLPYAAAGAGTEPFYNISFGHKKATNFGMQMVYADDLNLPTTFADATRKLMVYGGKVTLPGALGRAIVKV